MSEELESLRGAAGVLAACALQEIAPKVKIFGVRATDIGFEVEFEDAEFTVEQLEEKMMTLVGEDLPVLPLTMVPASAIGILRDLGLKDLARELDGQLIELVRIRNMCAPCLRPEIESTRALRAFKILTLEEGRLVGTVFSDKKALKSFCKAWSNYEKYDPVKLGPEMELFLESGEWLPRGMLLKKILIDRVYGDRDWVQTNGDHQAFFERSGLKSFSEEREGVMTSFFCSDEELERQVNSSLQFIEENAKIFDLKPQSVDRLGRLLTIAEVQTIGSRVKETFFCSMEQFVSHLLEKHEGKLPFWMVPEQARIICVGHKGREWGEKIQKSCEESGFRVSMFASESDLADRILNAEKLRIPYIVVVGEKEKTSETLTLREKRDRTMRVDEWMDEMREQLES